MATTPDAGSPRQASSDQQQNDQSKAEPEKPPPTDYQLFIRQFKNEDCLPVVNEVRSFLRNFPKNIPKEQAVRRLHAFLSKAEQTLLATPLYEDESEEFQENGCEGLEKFVTIRLYSILFKALGDEEEDERIHRHIASLQWIELKHLGVDEVAEEMFDLAKDQLRCMDNYKSPRDKLIVVMNTCRIVQRVVQQLGKTNFSADDYLPLLIFVLLKANPPHLHSNTEFITEARHPSRLRGEESYFFTNLCSAAAWISSITYDKLVGVTEEEFN